VPSSSSSASGLLAAWLAPFAGLFTRPTWGRVLVLVEGTRLTLHRRTISAVLRAAGQDRSPGFARYHRVLNRARWSARAAARLLLGLLVPTFAPSGPVVIGVDDTLERRWGKRIAARGL
jgi:DDE superfamily endonuclease